MLIIWSTNQSVLSHEKMADAWDGQLGKMLKKELFSINRFALKRVLGFSKNDAVDR